MYTPLNNSWFIVGFHCDGTVRYGQDTTVVNALFDSGNSEDFLK